MLLLVFLGTMGLAVTRGILNGKGRVGVGSAMVTAVFTCVLLLMEVQERYKIAIYPIFFLLVPYIRTWFSVKDNLAYEGIMKVFTIAKKHMKGKNILCKIVGKKVAG